MAVVDLRLPDESGLEVVRQLRAIDPSTAIVVLTGDGSIATALESVRLGAVHYLTKPTDADRILAAFQHGLASRPRTAHRHEHRHATLPGAVLTSRDPELEGFESG
jgi:two-component system response regulator RegA